MTPLSGVNDATAFTYAILAYDYGDPNAQGQNQLFPAGPGAKLPVAVPTANDLWREYFRYFLHYTGLKTLRIWIADYNWGTMAPDLWRSNPTKFFEVFDGMTYWAGRANVQLIPILGTSPPNPFDVTSPQYAAHVAFVKAVLAHGGDSVLVWDLWNEPNVALDPSALQTWGAKYLADVKPSSSKPVMIGTGNFVDFPDADWTSRHTYDPNEDPALFTLPTTKPHLEGEFGYWGNNTYGYWPWYATNAPYSRCAMVLTNNGKGAYADYPYLGALPDYSTAPSPSPPGLTPEQVQAMIDASLAAHTHPFTISVSKRTGTP